MLDKVKAYIKKNKLITPGDSIVLGVSGGADSVALLLLLSELTADYDLKLLAVHVNHNLRGDEALRDQQFTQTLCEELNVPLTIVSEQVAEYAGNHGIGCEEAGRQLRYKAFHNVALKNGADKIAVAHHLDDNAETVLFRIARGTGLKGLSGIAASRETVEKLTLIRPLLCVRRCEIEQWLAKKNRSFCIDSTNNTDEYSRNAIRNRILPELEALNNGATENICALSEQAAAAWDYLKRRAEEVYGSCIEKISEKTVKIHIPETAERVLFDIILRKALFEVAEHEKDITALHIRLLYELCEKQTGSRISLPYGVSAEKSYDSLILKKEGNITEKQPETSVFVNVSKEKLEQGETVVVSVPDYGNFVFSLLKKEEKSVIILKDDYTKFFDYDKIIENLTVRNASEGDVIAIAPEGGKKELKKLFVDCKIPREEREKRPVIAEADNILWVPGIRTGENRRVEKDTLKILKIEWRKQ